MRSDWYDLLCQTGGSYNWHSSIISKNIIGIRPKGHGPDVIPVSFFNRLICEFFFQDWNLMSENGTRYENTESQIDRLKNWPKTNYNLDGEK